jgi:hypothetical protein
MDPSVVRRVPFTIYEDSFDSDRYEGEEKRTGIDDEIFELATSFNLSFTDETVMQTRSTPYTPRTPQTPMSPIIGGNSYELSLATPVYMKTPSKGIVMVTGPTSLVVPDLSLIDLKMGQDCTATAYQIMGKRGRSRVYTLPNASANIREGGIEILWKPDFEVKIEQWWRRGRSKEPMFVFSIRASTWDIKRKGDLIDVNLIMQYSPRTSIHPNLVIVQAGQTPKNARHLIIDLVTKVEGNRRALIKIAIHKRVFAQHALLKHDKASPLQTVQLPVHSAAGTVIVTMKFYLVRMVQRDTSKLKRVAVAVTEIQTQISSDIFAASRMSPPAAKKSLFGCQYCGKKVEGKKRCSACKKTSYCSQACADEDWPEHQGLCEGEK